MFSAEEIANSFSKAANSYDLQADVQRHVADVLVSKLPQLHRSSRILEIGAGTGVLSRRLLKRYPDCSIDILDISSAMIKLLQNNLPAESRIRFLVTDARRFCSDVSYDLIVSNAAIHWMPPYEDLFLLLRRSMSEGGKIVISMMLSDTLGELAALRQKLCPAKKWEFELPTFEHVKWAFRTSGFGISSSEESTFPWHFASARELFSSLRRLGLAPSSPNTENRYLFKELRRIEKEYDVCYRDCDGVRATYHVGYFKADR